MVVTEKHEGTQAIDLEHPSDIQNYFNDTTVLLTGGTGFLGTLILEKLLRTCSDIKRVYFLIRTKKGKKIEQRFEEILESVLFDRLKEEQPKFAEKIVLISGDCDLPNLGLNDADKNSVINNVSCIFHVAANVRFNEKLRTATHINVRATRDILIWARQMKQLKSILYMSTAYSNCVIKEIREEFYEPTIKGEELINIVDSVNEDMLDQMTPTIIGKWPNTYAFTKAIAEDIIQTEGKGLPIAVVRPSIVIATSKEPIAGWNDNVYGIIGVVLGVALGVIHTLHCNQDCLADVVPADQVINCAIAASWQIGVSGGSIANNQISHKKLQNASTYKTENDIPIYNYVCSAQNPINWREFIRLNFKYLTQIPSPLIVWHAYLILVPNRLLHAISVFLLHTIPGYIVDLCLYCIGKQPMLTKGYKKINKLMEVVSYFAIQQWEFSNDNTQELWKTLSKEDQKHFNFDMDTIDWDTYFREVAIGGRIYVMKDPMETLPQGRIKYLKLKIAHYIFVALLLLGLFKILLVLWNAIF